MATLCTTSPGFGLGLRAQHYPDFQRQHQPLDWLEVITDNFLVEGGRPLQMLDLIRRDYPLAMHGVAMSLGSADGPDLAYLHQVKQLANRIQPLWVSDHLCWSGVGSVVLHDLNPLPYTPEAAQRLIAHIKQAQDILQRRLVVENVSSYVSFSHTDATECDFLCHVAHEADCLLLVDINNIYVSAVNHGFDPLEYIQALPAHRVQQMHLAGHSRHPTHIIDTHDHPVCEEVWALYAAACQRFGAVATMIERDDKIPPLPELLAEIDRARQVAQTHCGAATAQTVAPSIPRAIADPAATPPAPDLLTLQTDWVACVLQDPQPADAPTRLALADGKSDTAAVRLGIYHRAYRLRLCEVLRDSFTKTCSYMGSDLFDQQTSVFVVQHPPAERNLGRYGAALPLFFQQIYPDNPELHELAQLDWDLRSRFDSADRPALTTKALEPTALGEIPFLSMASPLHPSVLLRDCHTNALKLWRAIDEDIEVPAVQPVEGGTGVMVWRWGLQPHFMSLDTAQYQFMQALQSGVSIADAAQRFANTHILPTPKVLGEWLQSWLNQGVLRGDAPAADNTTKPPGKARKSKSTSQAS